jgi:glycerol-3-phosphate dehydrogenase (NAD(P)+)
MSEKIAVIGAGSWGTALANLLAKKGYPVQLWSHEGEVAESIMSAGENPRYLSGIPLDRRLMATADLTEVVTDAAVVVSVSPAQFVRQVMGAAAGALRPDAVVVSASKGIETTTLMTMAEVFDDILPWRIASRACFLSGPSFALEVAQEKPTAVAVASRSAETAYRMQELFQSDYFRVYTNLDVRGVELGGALKNVIALAAGMAAGLELGQNARAALLTRGLAEIARLGISMGANPLTFAGLAGMGDLILTCTGELSRNRSVGIALGEGRSLEEILSGMTMVAEGVETTRAAHALAKRSEIEMPIVAEVHAVLFEGRPAEAAVDNLMSRPLKSELWR